MGIAGAYGWFSTFFRKRFLAIKIAVLQFPSKSFANFFNKYCMMQEGQLLQNLRHNVTKISILKRILQIFTFTCGSTVRHWNLLSLFGVKNDNEAVLGHTAKVKSAGRCSDGYSWMMRLFFAFLEYFQRFYIVLIPNAASPQEARNYCKLLYKTKYDP